MVSPSFFSASYICLVSTKWGNHCEVRWRGKVEPAAFSWYVIASVSGQKKAINVLETHSIPLDLNKKCIEAQYLILKPETSFSLDRVLQMYIPNLTGGQENASVNFPSFGTIRSCFGVDLESVVGCYLCRCSFIWGLAHIPRFQQRGLMGSDPENIVYVSFVAGVGMSGSWDVCFGENCSPV